MEADIAFECWEFADGTFPVFDCPFCETGMMIPKQVIEETKAAKQKEKHLADQKEKTFVYDYNQM